MQSCACDILVASFFGMCHVCSRNDNKTDSILNDENGSENEKLIMITKCPSKNCNIKSYNKNVNKIIKLNKNKKRYNNLDVIIYSIILHIQVTICVNINFLS